jgi:hypothetical protein
MSERCLTVRQPWASLIIAGTKTVEHRRWRTDYRGELWIHAGLAVDDTAAAALPRGVILGRVQLVDVVRVEDAGHWMLAEPQALTEPFPCRGHLKLFPAPDDLARRAQGSLAGVVVAP